MKLRIHHATHYEYSEPVHYAMQVLYLTPATSSHQEVLQWQLHAPGALFGQADGYGNTSHTVSLTRSMFKGTIRAQGVVQTHGDPHVFDDERQVSPLLYRRHSRLAEPDRDIAAFAASQLANGARESDLLALAQALARYVTYMPGHTDVTTTAAQAFAQGKGVCQDQAHVFIAACRSLGIPARYVSGYFYAEDAPELASHAWVDVCMDVAARQWLSIDVTHGCPMDQRHVRLAVGPDYSSCPPVRGVRAGGGEESMQVHIEIRALDRPS